MRRRLLALGACVAVVAACTLGAVAPDVRRVTLLSVSDWHAQLEPAMVLVNGVRRPVGGAAALKVWLDRERAGNPRGTLVVMAGDSFGGTPPLSAYLEDVPAVEVQNALGVGVDTLGNHNFDHGLARLGKLVGLARFPYVSANVVSPAGASLVAPTHVVVLDGVRVGLIGITNPEAPALVRPGATGDYQFLDPVSAATTHAERLRRAGAQVVVVLAHLGALGLAGDGTPIGPLGDFARAVRGVDVVIGDHTDVSVNARMGDTLVVENRSRGLEYAVVDVTYDVARRVALGKRAVQRQPLADAVTPDPGVAAQLEGYRRQVQPLFDRKVGEAAGVIARAGAVESPLGSVIADALREAYGVDVAFVNSGAVRDDLPSSYRPADSALRRPALGFRAGTPWDVVVGDLHAILPFGNVATTFRISGRTLWAALEHSVAAGTMASGRFVSADGRFLHISGFRYRFAPGRPPGARVLEVALADGRPVAADKRQYTAATVDFLYDGGDAYTMLKNGTGVTRVPLTDTVAERLAVRRPLAAAPAGRIDVAPD
ncbi:MAG TPA: 5'-nucleotidase C-terminal domain-containing protein [Methylomirabilota bacterium]|nr:5'-nucleotidase C-terminal domain-containing protein [Methylomirabilota bacterium]